MEGSHCVEEVQRGLEVVCSGRRVEIVASDAVLAVVDVDTRSMCVPPELEEAAVVVLHLLLRKQRRLDMQAH